MKITTLLGSARKHGNTATVLGWVEDELTTMGHEVQNIYLNSLSIHGCLGCGKCKENPDTVACVQDDDGDWPGFSWPKNKANFTSAAAQTLQN